MAVLYEATVGERVAFYRRRRGITQEVLAGLLGRSVEWLAQFERGAKELDRLSTIVAVAHALGIEPVKLLPTAFFTHRRELHDTVLGTAPDWVPAIKSAMFRYNGMARLLGVPDRPPVDQNGLQRRIGEAFGHTQTERWSALGPLLPDLIADGWHAAHTTTGEDTAHGFGLLSQVLHVTSGMLDRIGEPQLSSITAERALAARSTARTTCWWPWRLGAWRWCCAMTGSSERPRMCRWRLPTHCGDAWASLRSTCPSTGR